MHVTLRQPASQPASLSLLLNVHQHWDVRLSNPDSNASKAPPSFVPYRPDGGMWKGGLRDGKERMWVTWGKEGQGDKLLSVGFMYFEQHTHTHCGRMINGCRQLAVPFWIMIGRRTCVRCAPALFHPCVAATAEASPAEVAARVRLWMAMGSNPGVVSLCHIRLNKQSLEVQTQTHQASRSEIAYRYPRILHLGPSATAASIGVSGLPACTLPCASIYLHWLATRPHRQ